MQRNVHGPSPIVQSGTCTLDDMTASAEPAAPATFPDPQHQPVMTVPDFARWLGMSDDSAYAAAKRGEIPTVKIGRLLFVPTAAARALVGLDRTAAAS